MKLQLEIALKKDNLTIYSRSPDFVDSDLNSIRASVIAACGIIKEQLIDAINNATR